MGIAESSVLDPVRRLRSWIGQWSGALLMETVAAAGGGGAACAECLVGLEGLARGYRCRSCGRLFCRKCMQNDGRDEAKFCVFCFKSIRGGEIAECPVSPEPVPESPMLRFRKSRFSQLVELPQQQPCFSVHSPSCSSCRSDEDEDADENGKHFFTPMSDFSQDVSDLDSNSLSLGYENSSLKSVVSSPLDSPSRVVESPGKHDASDHDTSGHARKPGVESEDRCGYDSLSVYCSSKEGQKAQEPLDFENNRLIWYPPAPEEEYQDAEDGYFEYDDEDDEVGDSGRIFSRSKFDGDALRYKERSNGANKEALKSVIHGHFTALVSQLLKAEGIHASSESSNIGWLEVVSSLAWQAAQFVKPDISNGGSMDPGSYVKVKCLASGCPADSALVKGVVCTKNVRHKRMISQHKSPRILILGGALEYQKVPNKLSSIDAVLQQEIDDMKMAIGKIEAHRPNVLLVEKTVSSYAQEYLLRKEISLVLNVKRSLLERIARCTGAQIVPSIDHIPSARLGQCDVFRIAKVFEDGPLGDHINKRSTKTLMFFEGCPRRLGCTVLLRGSCQEELKKLKHVVQYASFAAYHLSLETSFLADEGATLPKIPLRPYVAIPEKPINVDPRVSVTANSVKPNKKHQAVEEENKVADLCTKFSSMCPFPCSKVPCGDQEIPSAMVQQEKQIISCHHKSCVDTDVVATSPLKGDLVSEFPVDMPLCGTNALSHLRMRTEQVLTSQFSDHEADELEMADMGRRLSESHGNLKVAEVNRTDIVEKDEVPKDIFSTSESNQSILVSLSSSCILKGITCERSQLFRIKFYGCCDKPLGRYLRDDLFDQSSCCESCKEPAEAHVRCYTHQNGCLTINVKRLPFMKLPGERDGKIWMWHRCLKCEYKDGVPPAAPRVTMSDAAWGLSFGKFLELSFSNHTTANRIASCGHSLQRDCLRFYGFGSMVAFFRYSPVNILSVHLPPPLMDFPCDHQQEWVIKEAAQIFGKMEFLQKEVLDVIDKIDKKINNFECEPIKKTFQNLISDLKDLLDKERSKYNIMLPRAPTDNTTPVQVPQDILVLNHLRRSLLVDSYMWNRRLYLLDSFSKTGGATRKVDSELLEVSCKIKVKEWGNGSFINEGRLCSPPNGSASKPSALEVSRPCEEHNLHVYECKSNNSVEMDLSIESVDGYVGPTVLSMVSGYHKPSEETKVNPEDCNGPTFFEGLPSPRCNLSEKIDLAWSGTALMLTDPTGAGGSEANPNVPLTLKNSPHYRKLMSPVRYYSFDSAMRIRDKIEGSLIPAAHLSSVKSFDVSADTSGMIKDGCRVDSQRTVKDIRKVDAVLGQTPVYISSMSHMTREGARLLLPQTSADDIVIAVYDNEPTSIIAYAIHSQEYTDFITSKSDQHGLNSNEKYNIMQATQQSVKQFLPDYFHSQESGCDEPQALNNEVALDVKEPHFRISFDDESSIPTNKAKYSVTCYFAKQFDALRRKCCPSDVDFIRSLSRCKAWNAQGGKSNVYFAKSLDERFIIKQVTKTELESFIQFAHQYFRYLMDAINPGSPTCLAKVLGVYQVTVKHLKGGREIKMDVMVMENLFFRRSMSRVYDLKGGSSRARYNPDTAGENKVLLDLNLLETLRTKPIFLASRTKRRLERAIWNDTSFLASVHVMDYSLLVGIDEERKELVIGIIDFMRQYTWDKQLETWVKTSAFLGGSRNSSPTVISPMQYKKRFRKAMSNYFLTLPDQWPS